MPLPDDEVWSAGAATLAEAATAFVAGRVEEAAVRAEEAEACYRESLAREERALGPESHEVAAGLNNLAVLLDESGRHEEARSLCARAVAIVRAALSRRPHAG